MKWHGLNTNSTPTDDRPKVMQGLTNGLLQVQGEIQRRRGMARSTMAKLSAAWANFSGFSEYQGQVFAMVAYADKLEGFIAPGALWSDSQQTILSGYYALVGGVYSVVILRNGNQFSTGALLVARPGRCPGNFADGQLAVTTPLAPGVQSTIVTWAPPSQGDWRFSVIPTLNNQQGPADCLSPLANIFLFAGYNGTIPQLMYSVDGATWHLAGRASGHPANIIEATAWNPVSANWVYSMAGGATAWSPSGAVWTAGAAMPLAAQVMLGLSNGIIFAALDEGSSPRLYNTSNDGVSWTMVGTTPVFSPIAYTTDGTTLALVSNSGVIYKSTNNGATWLSPGNLGAGAVPYGMAYGGGNWIVHGALSGAAVVWVSSDLVTWVAVPGPATWLRVLGARYGNGRWIISGLTSGSGNYQVAGTLAFSVYFGITSLMTTTPANAIVFSLGTFAISSSNNANFNVYTTTDGITYTAHNLGTNLATTGINASTGAGAWAGLGF